LKTKGINDVGLYNCILGIPFRQNGTAFDAQWLKNQLDVTDIIGNGFYFFGLNWKYKAYVYEAVKAYTK
ncbi:MAG: hypothetical protein KKA19_07115, partial [Candidatus Margulisbacteria bacterium]|nr:hypothetical protein [Candidatus Margulisiibacteriota bacterium]